MNRQEFLKALNRNLKNLKKEERKKYEEYYDEMISDIMETGISEEKAVKRQGSVERIAADILAEGGDGKVKTRDWRGICLVVISIILMVSCLLPTSFIKIAGGNRNTSISIIGGADGPTSIFIAGKVGIPWGLYIATFVVVLSTVIYLVRKYRKH